MIDVGEKKRILIVDDSGLALRSIKKILDEHYDVDVVNSGFNCINYLKDHETDLIILDYDMPDFDGKQTFEAIKNNENTKDSPVLFLTGVNDREHIGKVLGLHPAGYILKPPDHWKLIATIASIFNNYGVVDDGI